MTHCRECNSEIAEADTFCPFCGITLEPASGGSVDADDKEISGPEASQESAVNAGESEPPEPPNEANGRNGPNEPENSSDFVDIGELKERDSEIVDTNESTENGEEADSGELAEAAVPIEDEAAAAIGDASQTGFVEPLTTSAHVSGAEADQAGQSSAIEDEDAPQELIEEPNIGEGLPVGHGSGPDEVSVGDAPAAGEGFHEDATLIDFSGNMTGKTDDEAPEDAQPEEKKLEAAGPVDESGERLIKESDGTGEDEEDVFEQAEGVDAAENETKPEPVDVETAASLAQDVKDVENPDQQELPASGLEESLVTSDDERPLTTPNIGGADTDGSNAPKLQPLDEGTVLNDRYEIVRKIGGGGMGAVYLASDKNLGGVLRAVKEMVQSYIEPEQQEKAIQDFKRESMLLTSLEHPAIPTIYDYFFAEKEARFYLVMKYISGGDLAARLRSAPEGRLEEQNVVQWAIEIADVLAYLHDRQPPIVYRDLKPANIMIDGNSTKVMLIDFGIARWINKEEKGVTAVGTMGYAPPELFSGNVVPASDIYSLGSTMFHLLTGADPQNNPLLIFDFQKHPRPRQINPNLTDQIEKILMKSVEYSSDKRFASAAEMRDELDRHLANLKTGRISFGIRKTPKSIALSDQPVFCGFCGQKIVATDMFCAFCGAKQPLAQPGVHSQEYTIPQTTARLVVEGTDELNIPSFELGKRENLVGRRDPMSNIFPEVDLSKYDPQTKVSRKHARIWREGDAYMVEDLGSSNGTIIIQSTNETTRLAPHQSRPLSNGDKIQVGDTTLHFVLG